VNDVGHQTAGRETWRAAVPAAASASRAVLERLLHDTILRFWTRAVQDGDGPGYRLNHDRRGRDLGPHPLGLIGQARTLWFYARLAGSAYGTDEHRGLADRGFACLRDHLRDERDGGFYSEAAAPGRGGAVAESVTRGRHLYEQAFALYALSRYALLTGATEPGALAEQLFDRIVRHAADDAAGGFHETFEADWTPRFDGPLNVLGLPPGVKTVNTHLHLLEAVTEYHRFRPGGRSKAVIEGLAVLLADTLPPRAGGVLLDVYDGDWLPHGGADGQRMSYGHNLEAAWLLLDAAAVVDAGRGLRDAVGGFGRRAFEACWGDGRDPRRGGFYLEGPVGRPATARQKVWWVQAEALVAGLQLWAETGDPRCGLAYEQTMRWIDRRQADHKRGGWHAEVWRRPPRVRGGKADAWKTPYHDGRAVLTCLEAVSAGAEAR